MLSLLKNVIFLCKKKRTSSPYEFKNSSFKDILILILAYIKVNLLL